MGWQHKNPFWLPLKTKDMRKCTSSIKVFYFSLHFRFDKYMAELEARWTQQSIKGLETKRPILTKNKICNHSLWQLSIKLYKKNVQRFSSCYMRAGMAELTTIFLQISLGNVHECLSTNVIGPIHSKQPCLKPWGHSKLQQCTYNDDVGLQRLLAVITRGANESYFIKSSSFPQTKAWVSLNYIQLLKHGL